MLATSTNNIFLIGPMGSGKTTIGKQLARILKMDFIDSDAEIESHTGVNIPMIFEYEGETGFRDREKSILNEISQNRNQVIATGGGSILNQENRDIFQANGIVIYLAASVEEQLKRTKRDTNRPLLQNTDRKKTLEALMQTREPLYTTTAHASFDTNRKTPKKVVDEIIDWLEINTQGINHD